MATQQVHTYCAMCVSRCGVVATVEDGVLTKVNADPAHPNGCICVKGTAAPEMVYAPDRLQYPMVRTRPKGAPDPGWARLSWDEAMALAATRLLDIKARYGPEAVVVASGTTVGTALIDSRVWSSRLANAFGSPNSMGPTHICNWHRDFGANQTYGVGTPPADYEQARCILLWGFNPQASWPAAAMRIARARARGAKLIVIDPRKAGAAEKADVWLRVRPGADRALALSMIHVLLEEGLCDDRFVREWTNGAFLARADTDQLLTEGDLAPAGDARAFLVWDGRSGEAVSYRAEHGYARPGVEPALSGTHALRLADGQVVACRPVLEMLRGLVAPYAPEQAEAVTWVPAEDVRRAVRLFAAEKPSCCSTWVGLEQHADAMQTNRAVCIFYALTGQFDQRGSNVLFASTPTNPVEGPELLPQAQAARRLGRAERPLGPGADPGFVPAYEVYRAIRTGHPYPVRALVAFGSDPLVGTGDPVGGKQALAALDFYVHVDLFANPSSSLADLVLPAASCWEREGLLPAPPPYALAEHTATWAQYREPVVRPVHESRSDLEIIFELAVRLGLGEQFFGGAIEAALNYQLAPSGLTVQQLREQPMGLRVDARTRYQKYAEIDVQTGRPRGFSTPSGKLELYATRLANAGYAPLPVGQEPEDRPDGLPAGDEEYPLVLTFARLVQLRGPQDRNIPRLRRQAPEPLLEIHPSTAAALGIDNGKWVRLETAAGSVRLKARFSPGLHPQVVATQYGWWQACQELGAPAYDPLGPAGANANLLIPNDVVDPISGSVPHRSQRCRVAKADLATGSAT
jgi:anaerobic selenocysteine-containing dehydrogenase